MIAPPAHSRCGKGQALRAEYGAPIRDLLRHPHLQARAHGAVQRARKRVRHVQACCPWRLDAGVQHQHYQHMRWWWCCARRRSVVSVCVSVRVCNCPRSRPCSCLMLLLLLPLLPLPLAWCCAAQRKLRKPAQHCHVGPGNPQSFAPASLVATSPRLACGEATLNGALRMLARRRACGPRLRAQKNPGTTQDPGMQSPAHNTHLHQCAALQRGQLRGKVQQGLGEALSDGLAFHHAA